MKVPVLWKYMLLPFLYIWIELFLTKKNIPIYYLCHKWLIRKWKQQIEHVLLLSLSQIQS
jgi:hypothetical protein